MGVPNRGPQITATTLLFLSLTWIVVVARCYARIFITKNFFLDDFLAAVCLILFTAYGAVGIAGVYTGVGRHVYDLPPAGIKASLKVWYICEIIYAVTATALRVTVGIFLLRIISRKTHRVIIHTLNAIGVAYGACYLATIVFQCIPLSYFWERLDMQGNGICFDANVSVKMTIGASVVAAVIDWSFGLLPIWILWSVQLSNRRKIMVCVLLGLGVCASTAPIVRLPYLAGLLNNADFLWATTDVAIWSVVELGIGLIVISLPACRALFRSSRFFASTVASGSNNKSGSSKSSANNRSAQRDTFHQDGLSSNSINELNGRETFLNDNSVQGDVESNLNIQKTVVVSWDSHGNGRM